MASKRSILAAVCGNALEYFDLMLYAHFMFILTPLFFPHNDPNVSKLMGIGAFVLGFIIRPFGSIFFGHLGDSVGRRKALSLSVGLMAIPTFFISILPTYAQIGIAAPIILLLCRIFQNFCVSGESSGSAIFLVEHAKPGTESRMSSLLNVSLMVGSILGTSLGYLCLTFLPAWGWRVPFVLGSFFGWLGFYIRYKAEETPAFSLAQRQHKITSIPLLEILKKYKRNFLCVMGVGAGVMVSFYIIYIYITDILRNEVGLDPAQILKHNTVMMFIGMCFLPLMGWLADIFSKERVMQIAALGLIAFAYPLFTLMVTTKSLSSVVLTQVVLGLCWAGLAGPTCALTTNLFPIIGRYSGIALAWSVGAIVFVGTAPFICFFLSEWLHDPSAPALYLAFCGSLCWLAVRQARSLPVDAQVTLATQTSQVNKKEFTKKLASSA